MKYNGNLDSLRALAALAVIGFHYNGFLPFGWAGVQLFFVLSGFLISGIVLRARDEGETLRAFLPRFFVRRSLRLWPLYLGYLSLLAVAWIALGVPPDFGAAAPGLFTYTQNWHKLFPSYPEQALYGHLWTLGVEWQFYLAWPFVLWAVPAARRTPFLVALVLLGPAARFVAYEVVIGLPSLAAYRNFHHAAEAVYVLPTSHLDAFALGALLCQRQVAQWLGRWSVTLGAAAATAILGGVAIAASDGQYRAGDLGWPPLLPASGQWVWGYSVLNLLSAAVIALVLAAPPALTRLPWLQAVGRISYGVYVFHMMAVYGVVMLLARSRRIPDFPGRDLAGVLIAGALAIGLAALSYRFVEAPLQRWGRRLFPAPEEKAKAPAAAPPQRTPA